MREFYQTESPVSDYTIVVIKIQYHRERGLIEFMEVLNEIITCIFLVGKKKSNRVLHDPCGKRYSICRKKRKNPPAKELISY